MQFKLPDEYVNKMEKHLKIGSNVKMEEFVANGFFKNENIATKVGIEARENYSTVISFFKKIKSLPLKALGIFKGVRVVEAKPPVDNEDICQEVQEDEQVDVEAPKREGGLQVTLESRPDKLAVHVSHVFGGD